LAFWGLLGKPAELCRKMTSQDWVWPDVPMGAGVLTREEV
jgi:hypothetical protein